MPSAARRLAALTACLLALSDATASHAQHGAWPTNAHDARRTAQSPLTGPATAHTVVRRRVPDGQFVNVAATIGADGTAYFGTWGLVQDHGEQDRSRWDKFDGQLFAWRLLIGAALFDERFGGPGTLDAVPYCHDYVPQPSFQPLCPEPPDSELSWWNGTVEGTATLSPDGRRVYVGRGDGKVYALDAASGERLWTLRTCNDIADCGLPSTNPEAGGEVIAGTLLRGTHELYVATWGVARSTFPETSAVYRLDAQSGELLWRHPQAGSVEGVFLATPALAPDGQTIYAASLCDPYPCTEPGHLYAFTPEGTLRWPPVELQGPGGEPLGAWTLAVGSDGTVFVGGGGPATCTGAFVSAHRPEDGALRWGPAFLPSAPGVLPCANSVGGLALREAGGQTLRVYATTNAAAELSPFGPPGGGRLFALDPADGTQPWGSPFFDPAAHGGFGNAVYPALDAAGTVYTGASGEYEDGLRTAYRVVRPGRVFAVAEDGSLRWQLEADGAIAWSHPVLGPGGVLYFGDARTRMTDPQLRPAGAPIFTGLDFAPALYAVLDAALPGEVPTAPVWLLAVALVLAAALGRSWSVASGERGEPLPTGAKPDHMGLAHIASRSCE
jgi:outer membrane protein assembly factor BamB